MSLVDNVTGLSVAIKPEGRQTFLENTVYSAGSTGLVGLIGGALEGSLIQLNSASVAEAFDIAKMKVGGTISPDQLIVDVSLPGKSEGLTVVDARIWMNGKSRLPGPPKRQSPTAKGFAISDAVIGFNLRQGSSSSELLINFAPVSVSKKPKPLSIQKVINRIFARPAALGKLLRVEAVSLSNPGLLTSLGGIVPRNVSPRDAVLGAGGANAAFSGAWFDSGPVLS